MRNLALAPDASFHASFDWNAGDLPISLPWRSTRWRYVVPSLWIFGCFAWISLAKMETPGNIAVIPYALLFIGLPALLAIAAAWWVMQLVRGRVNGSFVVREDRLEWQFETESDGDRLADCSRFTLAGKRGYEARIEWEVDRDGDDGLPGWPRWVAGLSRLAGDGSGRMLLARDAGLDHGDLESLCKLLNQLREEAAAHR